MILFIKSNYFKFLIVLTIFIINLFVYQLFDTKDIFTLISILPIALSAFFWRMKVAFPVAFVTGLVLFIYKYFESIPLFKSELIMLIPKFLIYIMFANVASRVFTKIEKNNIDKIDLINKSRLTGLYNKDKLFLDIKSFKNENYSYIIVSIIFDNFNELTRHLDNNTIELVVLKVINQIKLNFNYREIYSINSEEIVLIIDSNNINRLCLEVNSFYDYFKNSFEVGNYLIKLFLKIGFFVYNGEELNDTEILNRARIAAEKANKFNYEFTEYDDEYHIKQMYNNEVAASLKGALDKKEFYLVYHPIIDIKKEIIVTTETLIRWDRGEREPVGPSVFIKIAEETGFMG